MLISKFHLFFFSLIFISLFKINLYSSDFNILPLPKFSGNFSMEETICKINGGSFDGDLYDYSSSFIFNIDLLYSFGFVWSISNNSLNSHHLPYLFDTYDSDLVSLFHKVSIDTTNRKLKLFYKSFRCSCPEGVSKDSFGLCEKKLDKVLDFGSPVSVDDICKRFGKQDFVTSSTRFMPDAEFVMYPKFGRKALGKTWGLPLEDYQKQLPYLYHVTKIDSILIPRDSILVNKYSKAVNNLEYLSYKGTSKNRQKIT